METNYTNWIEYQRSAQKEWQNTNECLYNGLTLKELIEKSATTSVKDFNVNAEWIGGVNIKIDSTSDNVNHKFTCSNLWIAESINYPPDIFSFLEAIILSEEKEIFYFCDEEGPETFLHVDNLGNNLIRFVHLSQRVQCGNFIQTEDYKVRHDITIDKTEFIKTFYTALVNAIKDVDKKELEEESFWELDSFEAFEKCSPIIDEYLKKGNK